MKGWVNDPRCVAIATRIADRCHGKRKPGTAPMRYATIYQAAGMGAYEALNDANPEEQPNNG